jgi:hypothetical protein
MLVNKAVNRWKVPKNLIMLGLKAIVTYVDF